VFLHQPLWAKDGGKNNASLPIEQPSRIGPTPSSAATSIASRSSFARVGTTTSWRPPAAAAWCAAVDYGEFDHFTW